MTEKGLFSRFHEHLYIIDVRFDRWPMPDRKEACRDLHHETIETRFFVVCWQARWHWMSCFLSSRLVNFTMTENEKKTFAANTTSRGVHPDFQAALERFFDRCLKPGKSYLLKKPAMKVDVPPGYTLVYQDGSGSSCGGSQSDVYQHQKNGKYLVYHLASGVSEQGGAFDRVYHDQSECTTLYEVYKELLSNMCGDVNSCGETLKRDILWKAFEDNFKYLDELAAKPSKDIIDQMDATISYAEIEEQRQKEWEERLKKSRLRT